MYFGCPLRNVAEYLYLVFSYIYKLSRLIVLFGLTERGKEQLPSRNCKVQTSTPRCKDVSKGFSRGLSREYFQFGII